MITIKINGQDSKVWGLTPTKGCLNQLLKPATPRPIVYNENRSINGSVPFLKRRTLQRRTVTLNFLLVGTPGIDRALYLDQINDLQDALIYGENNTGVNRIEYVEGGYTYRMAYQDMNKFDSFGEANKALIAIRFVEINPTNR